MLRSIPTGFLLPATLVLSAAILLVSTALLESGRHASALAEKRLRHEQARATLRQNLEVLRDNLQYQLSGEGASALTDSTHDGHSRMRFIKETGSVSLFSEGPPEEKETLVFESPLQGLGLHAEWLHLNPRGEGPAVAVAWSAEDLSLLPETPAPDWWPLPGWSYSPVIAQRSPEEELDRLLGAGWKALPWIPIGEELPMSPEHSPALVPILRDVALRFGIFAAGTSGSRELTVRIRFYLEGRIWNPYNRTLRLHPGSRADAVCRLVFWNLPDLRIHNLSRGLSTAWISLDSSRNDFTGSRGIHGFIELPPVLVAGEELTFFEPDRRRQAEGLARTLHPGFRAGPADTISIEWRPSPDGIRASLLPMDLDKPVEAARSGAAWMTLGAHPLPWHTLHFPRADTAPAPFYLQEGSLSFRPDNAQARIAFGNRALARHVADPRWKTLLPGIAFQDAGGEWRDTESCLASTLHLLPDPLPEPPQAQSPSALFSWPEHPPENLLQASDLPQWRDGFRIGSTGAELLNSLVGEIPHLAVFRQTEDRLALDLPAGPEAWQRSVSVNLRSPESWLATLMRSAASTQEEELNFPLFPTPHATSGKDYFARDSVSLAADVARHCEAVTIAPFASIGAFLNSGFLIPDEADVPRPLGSLLPLRGFLRHAPPLVHRGSAWLLHCAVRLETPEMSVIKSARLWLLEIPGTEGGIRFETIRYEATDPDVALSLPPR